MFVSGYCSHCTATVLLAQLHEHQAEVHPGLIIYATLYRPDPEQMARNLAVADELMATAAADGKKAG